MTGIMFISAIKRAKLSFAKSGKFSKYWNKTYEMLQKCENFSVIQKNKCADKNDQLLKKYKLQKYNAFNNCLIFEYISVFKITSDKFFT